MTSERTFFTPTDAPPDQLFAVAAFYEEIHDDGVNVDRVELTEAGDVDLEYSLVDLGDSPIGDYADRVGDELISIGDSYDLAQKYANLGDLNAVASSDGEALSWFVKSEWVEQHRDGELSGGRFAALIEDTLTEVE